MIRAGEREDRALRADAQRNLERVLEAARDVFAEQGLDAPVTEIAARAHVGVGTIFRRFPTKKDLFVAVFEHRVRNLIASADAALRARDAGAGLRSFLRAAVAMQIADRGYCEAVGSDLFAKERLRPLFDELLERVALLLEHAQAAGAVRPDVTPADLPLLVTAVAHVGLVLEDSGVAGAWRRYLDLMVDGLAPEGARPLSRKPLTPRQLEALRCGRAAG
jgi:AcrR family transcriptional regulator